MQFQKRKAQILEQKTQDYHLLSLLDWLVLVNVVYFNISLRLFASVMFVDTTVKLIKMQIEAQI